ncbi:FeoB small GTPase domain-containing protein [Paenibacillus oceani]|uniref:50S ribosome-binding GTPase n=1 Tax=Paenibacillus oceani TaxID=2772510 RepID=A0A927H2T6_9BACL|nr:FeoB small GTPase domain-containing protein [Paenibacillus oceani]MBD2865622.1 50S ribosome-binding GTPase [Paenibacillus oceani]
MRTYTIALAGNPNTGKSTLFNTLTGLRQHTGNWAGKTVVRAEGEFKHGDAAYKIIDLPGTYSLYSNSADEEVARDYIIFEQPDVTIVVIDATSLERNLNLALQVLEMTNRAVVCVNLMDEAAKLGIRVDLAKIGQRLGVPVVAISARNKTGIDVLLEQVERVASGKLVPHPVMIPYNEQIERKIAELEPVIRETLGARYPTRWIALRLLDGDESLLQSLKARMDAPLGSSTAVKEVVRHEQPVCH